MTSFSIAIGPLIGIILLIISIIVIYYIGYTKRINRRLNEERYDEKRLWAPGKFAHFIVFAALIVISSIFLLRLFSDSGTKIDDDYYQAEYNFKVYSPEEMAQGYLQKYSIEENPGYTKTVEQIGDVKFTYFINNQSYDRFHPEFIIYAQYAGTKPVELSGYIGKFMTLEQELLHGFGAGGTNDDYICVLGNSSIKCLFQLEVGYYQWKEEADLQDDGVMPNANAIQIMLEPAGEE